MIFEIFWIVFDTLMYEKTFFLSRYPTLILKDVLLYLDGQQTTISMRQYE